MRHFAFLAFLICLAAPLTAQPPPTLPPAQATIDSIAQDEKYLLDVFNDHFHPGSTGQIYTKAQLDSISDAVIARNTARRIRLSDIWISEYVPPQPVPCTYTYSAWSDWSACVGGQQTRTRTVEAYYPQGCVGTPVLSETQPCVPPSSGIAVADVVVVVNTSEAGSQAMADAYVSAWGIPAANVVSMALGTAHELSSSSTLTALRNAIAAKGRQWTVLAFFAPSRYAGGQSITSAVTFGVRSVSALTVSPIYQYTGTRPMADKGVRPAVALLKQAYIRKDADGTKPTGTDYLVLANDQTGTPRGSARAGQAQPGMVVWDNRPGSGVVVGQGNNPCNYLSNGCWLAGRTPVQPVTSAFQSMYGLGSDGGVLWRKGYYGDHVTSYGGYLPQDVGGQTPLTYHLDRGASGSAGTVSEPYQSKTGYSPGSLVEQFVDIGVFLPAWKGGASTGAAMWASIKCPDRTLIAGDLLCAPYR